jgi:hypothetical protein
MEEAIFVDQKDGLEIHLDKPCNFAAGKKGLPCCVRLLREAEN